MNNEIHLIDADKIEGELILLIEEVSKELLQLKNAQKVYQETMLMEITI